MQLIEIAKEYVKSIYIMLGLAVNPSRKARVLVSILNENNNTGPSRFLYNLTNKINLGSDIKITRSPFSGPKILLVISNAHPILLHALRFLNVKLVLRVDGYSYPELYDNVAHAETSRVCRTLTTSRMRTNQQLQTALSLADFVIYQSEFSKYISDKYLYTRSDKFIVVYNGVNITHFKPITKSGDTKIVSCYGNLRDIDILNCTLNAFKYLILNKYGYSFRFRVIGGMTEEVSIYIEEYIKNNPELKPYTDIVGKVSYDSLAEIFPQSDVNIHLTAGDACPNAVLEALACGVPTVCQEYGGQSELVGDAGVILKGFGKYNYSEEVAAAAAEGCITIIENLELFSKRARARAEDNFSNSEMAINYEKIFQKLVS